MIIRIISIPGTLLAISLAAQAHAGESIYGAPDERPTRTEVALVGPAQPAMLEANVGSPYDDSRSCVRRWRTRAWIARAADAATTVAAIESGRGKEYNPVARVAFGKDVNSSEALGFMAGMIGISEWFNHRMTSNGDWAGACRNYRVSTLFIGGFAGLNLRVHF